MATPKLDIFRVLNAANDKNVNFYRNLTEEEQKAFMPFVVARWLSGTNDARQVIFIGELLNGFTFTLQQHKELLWYLITICSSGRRQKYTWNKLPGQTVASKPMAVQVLMEYYGYSTAQANEALPLLDKEDVIAMAEELSYQTDELTKLKKEFKVSTDEPVTKTNKKTPSNDLLDF